jgi:hypothetical protein
MRNFNVYDPMKRGQGLTLEGQSLAHLEVPLIFSFMITHNLTTDSFRYFSTMKALKMDLYSSF